MIGGKLQYWLVVALGAAISAAIVVARTNLARERLAASEEEGGCLACGSPRLETSGETVTCLSCGYSGRADGGGKVSETEVASLFEPSDR